MISTKKPRATKSKKQSTLRRPHVFSSTSGYAGDFVLDKTWMVESGYQGNLKYSALRRDIRKAFLISRRGWYDRYNRRELYTIPYKTGDNIAGRASVRMGASSVRIGCCLFDGKDAEKLKKWALAGGKTK
jgi:hypothetical protein